MRGHAHHQTTLPSSKVAKPSNVTCVAMFAEGLKMAGIVMLSNGGSITEGTGGANGRGGRWFLATR